MTQIHFGCDYNLYSIIYKPLIPRTIHEILLSILDSGEHLASNNDSYLIITICEEGCTCAPSTSFCFSCKNDLYKLEINTTKCVDECKDRYPYFVLSPKQCFFTCKEHPTNTKNYNHKCVSTCPLHTSDINGDCLDSSLFISSTTPFVSTTQSKEVINNTLDTNLLSYLKVGKSIKGSDFILQIYSTDKPLEDNNETSTLLFPECEAILRFIYFIDSSSPLIISKFDLTNDNGTLYTNKMNFRVFDSNRNELNMSYCQNTSITVSYKLNETGNLSLSEGKKYAINDSIDIYNPKDDFFNDVCYAYSQNGNDIALGDRRDSIYPQFK